LLPRVEGPSGALPTGAIGRFKNPLPDLQTTIYADADPEDEANHYKISVPGLMWNGTDGPALAIDGGRDGTRKKHTKA
jgi:hypothetical protein